MKNHPETGSGLEIHVFAEYQVAYKRITGRQCIAEQTVFCREIADTLIDFQDRLSFAVDTV